MRKGIRKAVLSLAASLWAVALSGCAGADRGDLYAEATSAEGIVGVHFHEPLKDGSHDIRIKSYHIRRDYDDSPWIEIWAADGAFYVAGEASVELFGPKCPHCGTEYK